MKNGIFKRGSGGGEQDFEWLSDRSDQSDRSDKLQKQYGG